MVRIALPPPTAPPDPLFYDVPAGTRLVRLFDPTTPWKIGPLTFNANGPRHRFDHHRLPVQEVTTPTWDDPERRIYYCALTFSCCVVEVFGDYRLIDRPQLQVACPIVTRDLRLLDLCHQGAMRAGAVSALCGTADRQLSQAWSRYFYEDTAYRSCDGLRYHSAHNNEAAFALYERAEDALDCPPDQVLELTGPGLRPGLLTIAREHGLIVMF